VKVTTGVDTMEVQPVVTRSGRQLRNTSRSDYVYATMRSAEEQAYMDEILHLFNEKEVLKAVKYVDVKPKHKKDSEIFHVLKEEVLGRWFV